ncbi:MAG: glucose 1-dehydrogenase [Acidobacteriota bacterium]|nr:glucose 1-dehydrogenase [Acidobacteriota bacterium]
MRFQNKVAVITGGNSGIGLASAHRLQQEGAQIAIFGRNQETLASAGEALGGDTLTVQGDVADNADLDRLIESVTERFGRIDTLVVNAGVAHFKPLNEVDEDHFDLHFNINVKGAYYTIQKALPLLAEGASVVLVGSVVTQAGFPGSSIYSASKAALRSFARTLSAELLPRKIRVNVVSPGPVETPIFDRMGAPKEQTDGMKQGFSAMVPLNRMGTPEEIAGVVAFLGSDDASFVVGADVNADGGMIDLLPQAQG